MNISIIIPILNLNRKKNLKKFYKKKFNIVNVLETLKENKSHLNYEIICVCNNNSDIRLVEFIQNNNNINKYCINSTNPGVARSWNIGANLSEGDALYFLNDDCSTNYLDLNLLYKTLYSSNEIAIVGPEGIEWGIDAPLKRIKEFENIKEVDCINGYSFMIKKNIYHEAGGFDNNYTPAFYEETDMCFRVRNLGYKIMAVPGTNIKHYEEHGVSSRNMFIKYFHKQIHTKVLTKRNRDYFIKKWSIHNK